MLLAKFSSKGGNNRYFHQHGQPEQGSEAVAGSKLSTASKSALKLFTQGLDSAVSHGSSCFFHRLILQMFSMILEVADLPADGLLIFSRPLALRLQ